MKRVHGINIGHDPCFVALGRWVRADDPNRAGLPDAVWIEGDYHLKSEAGRWDALLGDWMVDEVTSPCVDAGDPTEDVREEPLPHGERINLGVYGGTPQASKSPGPVDGV